MSRKFPFHRFTLEMHSQPALRNLGRAREGGSSSMNERFRLVIETLEPKFRQLTAMPPVHYANLSRPLPSRAIYLFSESDRPLYVGRTNGLRARLRGHCVPSATHFSATLAFRLARETTGMHQASYSTEGFRVSMVADAIFRPAFAQAKRRVAGMEIRYYRRDRSRKSGAP